jgi:hypothetical protein
MYFLILNLFKVKNIMIIKQGKFLLKLMIDKNMLININARIR